MATQVIVVDDDPIVGNLSLELLKEAGLSAVLIQDSLKAQAAVKAEKPELVILDILMPGIDGLTLLHRLKTDPETAGIRAIIVSGKSFEAEKTRARQYGAELFIEKPYDVDSFGKQVAAFLKPSGADAPRQAVENLPSLPPPARADLKLSVWGCRTGTAGPATGAAASRYGWRTPCLSIELEKSLMIFDAGSGIGPLGDELRKNPRENKDLWLFLTHFHRDHIQGLADFSCARDAAYTLNVVGTGEPHKSLEAMLAEAFEPAFGAEGPPCRIELYEVIEQTYEILPGARLTAFFSNHPGATLGFVLHAQNKKIVYCPDGEVYGEAATALQDYDEKLGGLIRDADVLVHDGRFTDEDYKKNRNSGHSSFMAAVDLAGHNKIKKLLLVHQDARYDDNELDRMAEAAEARVAERGYAMKVLVGREGLDLNV